MPTDDAVQAAIGLLIEALGSRGGRVRILVDDVPIFDSTARGDPTPSTAEQALWAQDKGIEAIKQFRARTGFGLRESSDILQAWWATRKNGGADAEGR